MFSSLSRYIDGWKVYDSLNGWSRKCSTPNKYSQNQIKRRNRPKSCIGKTVFGSQAPMPPIESIFNENKDTCHCCTAWITVFAYPKQFEYQVLCHFGGIAHIVDKYISETGNWMHLRLQSNLDCRNAMMCNYCVITPELSATVSVGAPVVIMNYSEAEFSMFSPDHNQNHQY